MKPTIEIRYHVRIEFDTDSCLTEDRVWQALDKLEEGGLYVVTWRGGPCFSPGIEITGQDSGEVEAYATKALRLLKRYKGVTILCGAEP